MQVRYIDEYGTGLYWGQNVQPIAPVIGDTVIIEDEEYRVKSRTFLPEKDEVVIEITQNIVRSKDPEDSTSGRLREMNRAIVDIGKRQDSQDKLTKSLREQTMSIRQHIRSNQPKPKETQ